MEKNKSGYANKYLIDLEDLKILNLSSNNLSTLHWITMLLHNRNFILKSEISKMGKEFLINIYSLSIQEYDLITGYRADDSYFTFAESFLNNGLTLNQLSKALYLGQLGEQVVLKSQKAFDRIKFIGYERANSSKYYPLRVERNEKAKEELLTITREFPKSDDIFLNEIMKKGGVLN